MEQEAVERSIAILSALAAGATTERVSVLFPSVTREHIAEAAALGLNAVLASAGNASASAHPSSMERAKAEWPNAYQPWTTDEEQLLRTGWSDGKSVDDLADELGRQPSAIRSRLQRLGERL